MTDPATRQLQKRYSPADAETKRIPERGLIAAVLRSAVADYFRGGYHGDAAEVWIYANEKTPFSFFWICEFLDLEPLILRERLRRMIKGGVDTTEVEFDLRYVRH